MDKLNFLIAEFLQFSIQAGFTTRNEDFPIYDFESGGYSLLTAKAMRNDIKEFLMNYYDDLRKKKKNEEDHIQSIRHLSLLISSKYKNALHNKKFRIGISQKVINLFLKYLWCSGLISEPFHCPFDNIIKMKIQKYNNGNELVDWTEMNTIKQYCKYVEAVTIASNKDKLSIAEWELKNWKRRQ